jgi:hypothetical protein
MLLFKPFRGIQLNRSHPLARGLVGCWLMNENGGNKVFDLSDNRNTGSLTNVTWTPGGVAIAASVSRIVSAASGFNASEGSIEMLVKPAWSYDDGLAHYFWQATITAFRKFTLRKNANNTTELFTNNTSRGTFTFAWAANTLYHVVLNWGTNTLYINKVLEYTFTAGGLGTLPPTLYIGDAYAGANLAFSGNIYYFCVRNRALSATEIAWLYREPFAMFEQVSVGKLLGTLPAVIWLAGSAEAQSQGSALCKVTRKVSATADCIALLSGTLTVSTRLPWFAGSLAIERLWLREVLFNCMSTNAFNLGTVLTGGWFWVRKKGCSALYRGAGMEQIDLTNILAIAAQDAREIRPPSYLLHNSNSTYFYVVRRFNNCGYREYTLRAAVKVSMDAGGALAKPQPNNVFCSKTEQTDGDKIRLVWFYCPLEQKSKPARFKIYWDGQTGQIDYDNPVATINYQGRKYYNYETIALEAGRYLFAIRAEDASGVENNSLARSRIDLHTTTPNPVTILSVETV